MKALIPCAGNGTRLMPLTRHTPKCMLEVGGKPIVQHIVNQLVRHNIRDIWISLQSKGSAYIRRALGYGENFGARIDYLHEGAPKGTAGTIRGMYSDGHRGPLLVHYGDVLSDLDLGDIDHSGWATAVCHRRGWKTWSGVAVLSNDCISNIMPSEKDLSREFFARHWDKMHLQELNQSYRFCIDSPERLSEARSFFEHEYHRISAEPE